MKKFKKYVASFVCLIFLSSPLLSSGAAAKSEVDFYKAQIGIIEVNFSNMIEELPSLTLDEKISGKQLLRMYLHGESIESDANLKALNLLFQKVIDTMVEEKEEKAMLKQLWSEAWHKKNRDLRQKFFTAVIALIHDTFQLMEDNMTEIQSMLPTEDQEMLEIFIKHYMKMVDELLMLYGERVFGAQTTGLSSDYDPVLALLEVAETFVSRSDADIPEEVTVGLAQARMAYSPELYKSFQTGFSEGFLGGLSNEFRFMGSGGGSWNGIPEIKEPEFEYPPLEIEAFEPAGMEEKPLEEKFILPMVKQNPKHNLNSSIRNKLRARRAEKAQ